MTVNERDAGVTVKVDEWVHKRDEESAGRVAWVKLSLKADLWKKESSKKELEGLQDCTGTCYDLWFGVAGKDGAETRADISKDVKIFISSDQKGQD